MSKLSIQILILATSALSTIIDGENYCLGPYALCSTSTCQPIPGNVTCACEGPFKGINLGNTTCKARSESLISTFSLHEQFESPIQPPIYTFVCEGGNAGPWADCLDAPCSTASGSVVCTCPLQNASSNYYSGQTCPTNALETKKLCAELRSAGGSSGGLESIGVQLSAFYGNPPDPTTCNPPNSTES